MDVEGRKAGRTERGKPEGSGDPSFDHARINDVLPVDEHVEEVLTQDGARVRRFGVYLLPNLITTGTLAAGFVVLVCGLKQNYELASFALVFAIACDGLDGRVARLANAQSVFGTEYDSLSDMVAFGVAPALLLFSWAEPSMGTVAWAASLIFMACAAMRLARFNSHADEAGQRLFQGMPSPPAAGLVTFMIWVAASHGAHGDQLPAPVAAAVIGVTLSAALLMVSNIGYLSFKELLSPRGRVPFAFLMFLVLLVALVMIDPQRILLGMALVYFVSGPLATLYRVARHGLRSAKPAR